MRRAAEQLGGIGRSAGELVRRHKPDYQIALFMGILVAIGLVVLVAISPARVQLINSEGHELSTNHFMYKQLVYLAIGLAAFVTAAVMPFKAFWQRLSSPILLAGIGACLLLAFLGLFMDGGLVLKSGGATRWFNLGVATFQPAELLKFGLLLYLAVFLGRRMRQGRVDSLNDTIWPVAVLVAVASLFVIVFQKDMGTGLTMLGMVAAMLLVSGLSWRWIGLASAALVGFGLLAIITSPHRIERVVTFFNPAAAPAADSYHIEQATIAIGSGGLTGRGLGQSRQAFGYLPEAVNDSIFAIFGETFGFIGLMAILLIFMALLLRLLRAIDHLVEPEQRLLMAGVFGLIMSHLAVNVGSMTGVFPLTGVTLPFLSFGGTSLLFTMLALGLAFQITRYTSHRKIDTERTSHEAASGRRRVGGTRYTSSRRSQRS